MLSLMITSFILITWTFEQVVMISSDDCVEISAKQEAIWNNKNKAEIVYTKSCQVKMIFLKSII